MQIILIVQKTSMLNKYIIYKNAKIGYKTYGSGKGVVFIHGFGEDSSIWDEQVNFLQAHCRLLVPDLPGSGQSALLQQEPIGVEEYADCINALLNQEQVDSFILLGHSMGGYITLAFAEKYAGKLKGFGLVHSTAFADSEEKKASRQQGIRMINEYGAFAFLKNILPNLFSKDFKTNQLQKVTALVEKSEAFSSKSLIQYYTAMMNRADRTAVLKNAVVPVLFVMGTEDTAAPLDDLLQQVTLPNMTHLHILENVGHMSMLEAPDELNNFLLKFINNC